MPFTKEQGDEMIRRTEAARSRGKVKIDPSQDDGTPLPTPVQEAVNEFHRKRTVAIHPNNCAVTAASLLKGVSSEAELHYDILEECKRRGWIPLHGSMAHIAHRTKGEPDFTIIANNQRVFFVECKSATGKISIEQRDMIAHAKKLGTTIHVCRSMAEFYTIVDLKKSHASEKSSA